MGRWTILGAALISLLSGAVGAQAGLASFQEEGLTGADSAEKGVEIRAGDCDDVDSGEVVASLTAAAVPEGEGVGKIERAVPAAASFTNVPLPLETLLAEDHAVVVFASVDEDAAAIACGVLGGIARTDDSLVIGLAEVAGSGWSGIAFLGGGADGLSTNVSLFVAEGLAGNSGGGSATRRGASATPEA